MQTFYGATRRWQDFDGSTHRVTVTGFGSTAEAQEHIDRAAREAGWTPPRWWQIWRWGEH